MNPYRRFSKAALLSLIDVFKESYTYHSGALTYHFLLSMAPLTVILINLLGFLPLIELSRIEETIDQIFPQYTNKVIHEILEVQKRSKETSAIALGLSYFFSVGFIRYLGKAFSFVSEGELTERRELFYWVFMPAFLLGLVLIISSSFFLSIYLKLVVPKNYSVIIDLSYVLPGTLTLFALYRSFIRGSFSILKLLAISAYVSFLMFASQLGFTWYIANVFKGSLLYGSLTTIIISLLWINLIFLTLLYGARLIYRLRREP